MDVRLFVDCFASGLKLADQRRPIGTNKRTGVAYQPGIGPHTESETIALALAEVVPPSGVTFRREVPYPSLPRSRCDVVIESADSFAIEVKMLRLMGDNGKPNDNILMHLLSPYPAHRSALTDCSKLLESGFDIRKAIVIFGYDYGAWPMDPAIEAFETLAARQVVLGDRSSASFVELVHPVHVNGRVFGWEILAVAS